LTCFFQEILTEGDYFDKDRYRLGARLSIQKDYVQAVLPIAKVSSGSGDNPAEHFLFYLFPHLFSFVSKEKKPSLFGSNS
jgi:hypothetical protein